MSIYLLRKQARRVGLLLREVPGGGWCLLDAARGGIVTRQVDLEHIEKLVREKETAADAANIDGGRADPESSELNESAFIVTGREGRCQE